ncbi:MAG: hypothetical protein HZB20_11605, partial [Chloroflexi bacterium]|nr:hypothetical protein [Chloroflexota bacterium]
MSNDPQQPGTEILKRIVEKLKVQEFLFALGLVVALAVFGGFILPDYIPLIYLATGVALILYTVTVVTTAYRKVRDAKEGATQARREPSTVIVTVLPPAPSVEPVRPALSEFEQLTMYLDRVRNTNNILRLVGISAEASDPQKSSAEARTPTSLSDVFISLRIDRYRGEPEEQAQGKPDREHQQEMARLLERERKQLTAIEALSDPKVLRCVMLGQPGSGKSSVLRYAAYRLAESFLSPERLKETMPEWQAGEMLSVLAPLALLAESLPARAQGGKLDDHVVAFVQAQVEWCAEMNGFARRVWREARERGVLFLFDGLDEVAPEKRAVVKEAIDEFLSARGKCRAVVTCRTYSYGDDKWRLEGWPAYNIEPLSRGEQESFIQKWYQTLIQNDAPSRPLYEKKAQSLEGAIFSGDARQLHQISGTPLLLTLIAIVHTHQEELPRSRILIYRECVNLLLLRWQKRRQVGDALKSIAERMKDAAPTASGLADKVLEGLAEVAYQARDRDAMKHGDSMLIDLYLLRQVMMRYLPEA